MSEKSSNVLSGYLMLVIGIVLLAVMGVLLFYSDSTVSVAISVVVIIIAIFIFSGLLIVNPNEAKVMVLFGSYAGYGA